jgi:hypothetical protein
LAYLVKQDSNQTYYCDSMCHDENPSNGSTTYPFVGVPMDYPYGPTSAPLIVSAPAISPASNVYWDFPQAQTWMTAPVSPTVTLSPCPIPRYREIRPRRPHEPAPTLPPIRPEKYKQRNQHRELERGKHSKLQSQVDQGQVQKTAKRVRQRVSEATDTTKKPMRVGGRRYVWLDSLIGISCSG